MTTKMRIVMFEGTGDAAALGMALNRVLAPVSTPVEDAAAYMRERGHEVERAPGAVPGLWLFDGREVTERQLLSIANGAA